MKFNLGIFAEVQHGSQSVPHGKVRRNFRLGINLQLSVSAFTFLANGVYAEQHPLARIDG